MIVLQLTSEEFDQRIETICDRVISRYITERDNDTLDYDGVAKLLRKSVSTIKRMKASGELIPVHPSGRPRFLRSEVIKKKYCQNVKNT